MVGESSLGVVGACRPWGLFTRGGIGRRRGHVCAAGGVSFRPGTFPCGRGHSTPSGTGFLSPNAQAVPDREGMHPHAQDVPVEIGRPGVMSIQC